MSSDAYPLSPYLDYLARLEGLRTTQARVLFTLLGRGRGAFLQRGWVTPGDYLTHVMVPFFGSEQEVEVQIDEDAGVYRYRSLQVRGGSSSSPWPRSRCTPGRSRSGSTIWLT